MQVPQLGLIFRCLPFLHWCKLEVVWIEPESALNIIRVCSTLQIYY